MSRCYAGRCPGCKNIVAACVDEPGRTKDTAKWVAGFIRDGLTVEQMDTEQVRVTLQRCDCNKSAQLELVERAEARR